MTLICMKMKVHAELIFIWKVSHLDSFWNRGKRELRNGLLVLLTDQFSCPDSVHALYISMEFLAANYRRELEAKLHGL